MKSYLKQFSYSLIAWVFVTLFDTFRTMSSIAGSGEKISAIGVKISIVESAELLMNFALTSRYAVATVLFICVWLALYSLYTLVQRVKARAETDE